MDAELYKMETDNMAILHYRAQTVDVNISPLMNDNWFI